MQESTNLSAEKQYLLTLSDKKIRQLLMLAKSTGEKTPCTTGAGLVLPKSVEDKYEKLSRIGSSSDDKQLRWKSYVEQLKKAKYRYPTFYQEKDERALYRYFKAECEKKNLPPDFIKCVVPAMMGYAQHQSMRPILLVGPPGCGKTTAAKAVAEILKIPSHFISVLRATHSHGIYGETQSYQGADLGELARGIVINNQLNVMYIIDEIDKCAQRSNQNSTEDEMLSICDESAEIFEDNFLGFPVSLQHSPIIFTGNELEAVSDPLRDRCTIYVFSAVALDRIQNIVQDHAETQWKKKYKSHLTLDTAVATQASAALYHAGVSSLRQHLQLVDGALERANDAYFEQETDAAVLVEEGYFTEQRKQILNAMQTQTRKLGF